MASGVVALVFAVTRTERIKTALIDDARTSKRFHRIEPFSRTNFEAHLLSLTAIQPIKEVLMSISSLSFSVIFSKIAVVSMLDIDHL